MVVIFFLAGKAISLTTVYKIEAESFFDIRLESSSRVCSCIVAELFPLRESSQR